MSWKKEFTKTEKLSLVSGKYSIVFLDNGEAYEFERFGETKHGVSFTVNAKNLDTNANFPSVKWGVTARSILKQLGDIDDLVGWTLKLTATGEGLQRRYPEIELIAPKKQSKL